MAGLLDYNVDPIAQGLLGFSQGMLTPRAQGGGVGAALGGFNQNAMAAQNAIYERQRQQQQDALKTRLTNAQIGEFDSQAAERTSKMADMQRKMQVMQQTRAEIAQKNPDLLPYFDADPVNALKRIYPEMKFETMFTPDGGEQKAFVAPGMAPQPVGAARGPKMEDIGGVAQNPYALTPGAPINDPNKLMHTAPGGGLVLNRALADAKAGIARAGAPNVSMKVENKMGESVGAQVGPMLKASTDAMGGSVKMADAAERVLSAIDKGGVIAGPGASLRLKGAQVASMLGIGGKDSVSQTRQVIRGLAESSVEARKELAGQGQVTESEAKAVDKAMSGNIDELTVEEIRDIAKLNLRAAANRAKQHQQKLDAMPESMSAARPFYQVPGMDNLLKMPADRYSIPPPPGANVAPDGRSASGTIRPAGSPSLDDLLRKYGGNAR